MSKKRFVLYEHKGNYYILENPRLHLDFIEMLGDALTDEEIVDLLNKQQSTIMELNKQNEQLQKELDNFKPVMFQDMQNGTVILYAKGGIDE